MEDTDGYGFVTLDSISLSGIDNVEVSFWMRIEQASWEYTDSVKVWATDTTGQEVVVFSDTDMDDQTQGSWRQYAAAVHSTQHGANNTLRGQCTVIFGSGSSSGSEGIWMDHFVLTGYAAHPILSDNIVGTGTPNICGTELVVPTNISGCTAPAAHNYKPWSSVDDGGCVFAAVDMFGCPVAGRMASLYTIMIQSGQHYITPATRTICAQMCLDKFGCVSYAYSSVQNRCYLKSRWDPDSMIDVNGSAAWESVALHGCSTNSCGGACH